MPSTYTPRVLDSFLAETLQHPGAVVLEGARGCGKTATGLHHAQSSVQLDIDDLALQLAELDAPRLLQGARPRFIDEWQLAPRLWNLVRAAVDADPDGRFVLAGSATPADDATRHTGAGRFLRVRMRPMSLFESGWSTGDVSLGRLLGEPTERLSAMNRRTLDELVEAIVRGGWPGLQELPLNLASSRLSAYLEETARVDIARLDGEPDRDPAGVLRLLRSLGRHIATETSVSSLGRDSGEPQRPMSDATVGAYLKALERVFVVEDQPSWGPPLISRDRVRKAAKRHFVDPSLAAAAIGAGPDRLVSDPEYLGFLFESLCIRDLRIYAGTVNGRVLHYRDSAGREVDAIVERRDGSWAAIEVKLSPSRVDEAAASLRRFAENLDRSRTPPPLALIVLTTGDYAHTRPDGIHVVPISCLGP